MTMNLTDNDLAKVDRAKPIEGELGFRPLGDLLVVRPDEPMKKSGLLYLPDVVVSDRKAKVCTGTVVAMGPGMVCADGSRWPMPDCKVGDRIVFYRGGAEPLRLAAGEFLKVRDDFVLAVLEED